VVNVNQWMDNDRKMIKWKRKKKIWLTGGAHVSHGHRSASCFCWFAFLCFVLTSYYY
jgi:hypothetical protein